MKTPAISLKASTQRYALSLLTVIIAVIIGLAVLNPIWANLSPPFPILRVSPPITAPVDGPYYLKNVNPGYQWNSHQEASLWYHPLLPSILAILPSWLPLNIWFWLLSIFFSFVSLLLLFEIISIYTDNVSASPVLLLLTLLLPAGLEMATGNPEIPTLFFASLVLLSVIKWQNWRVTALAAVAAILTKPNALYMIPILVVYGYAGYRERNRKLLLNSAVGVFTILVTWVGWIAFVDWKSNSWGAYWQARKAFANYVAGDPTSFFLELARSYRHALECRDRIRYSTALMIPLVNLWVIAFTPLPRDIHRYALAAGNLGMMGLALWQGNPNKMIVYSTTLPGYFAVHIIFIQSRLCRTSLAKNGRNLLTNVLYVLYLIFMGIVYIIGTPCGWYY